MVFVEPSTLHLAEDAFPLHLPFQPPESLVDIVVADQYLQEMFPSACFKRGTALPAGSTRMVSPFTAWALSTAFKYDCSPVT